MRASRASPTCVDRPGLWRSRISGAPRANSPSEICSRLFETLVLHRIRDTRSAFEFVHQRDQLVEALIPAFVETHLLVPLAARFILVHHDHRVFGLSGPLF